MILKHKQLPCYYKNNLLVGCFSFFLYFLLILLLVELQRNPVEGFSAGLIDDSDVFKWEVVVIGPEDTIL